MDIPVQAQLLTLTAGTNPLSKQQRGIDSQLNDADFAAMLAERLPEEINVLHQELEPPPGISQILAKISQIPSETTIKSAQSLEGDELDFPNRNPVSEANTPWLTVANGEFANSRLTQTFKTSEAHPDFEEERNLPLEPGSPPVQSPGGAKQELEAQPLAVSPSSKQLDQIPPSESSGFNTRLAFQDEELPRKGNIFEKKIANQDSLGEIEKRFEKVSHRVAGPKNMGQRFQEPGYELSSTAAQSLPESADDLVLSEQVQTTPTTNEAPFIAAQSAPLLIQTVMPAPEKMRPEQNGITVTQHAAESSRADILPTQIGKSALPAMQQVPNLPARVAPASDGTPADAANIAGRATPINERSSEFAAMLNSAQVRTNETNIPAPAQAAIDTPLHDQQWGQNLGEKIVWLAKSDQQSAQIHITPPQLGPLQITLNLNGDQASIAFTSPHGEVRQAIQDAMPQLREMLSASGINLGQTNVGSQQSQSARDFAWQFANENRSVGENAILPAENRAAQSNSGLMIQRGRGLVDLFA